MHRKKTYKRRGGFLEGYLPESLTNLFKTTPTTAPQVVEKPGEAVTKVVETTAEVANVPTSSSPGGIPGGETSVDQAKMLGGRRRKSRKHRRRKSRRT